MTELASTGLVCPKCQAPMRQYERNGVVVDQCTDCRGIFLDRGELERLVDAERAWNERAQPVRPAPPAQAPQMPPMRDDDWRGHSRPPYDPRRRKKSFFDELFD